MASSSESNKRIRTDDAPYLLSEDDVKDLVRELTKYCESAELAFEPLQERLSRIPLRAGSMIRDNGHAWFSNDDTPLFAACANKNVDANIVKALLHFWPGSAFIENTDTGTAPLHMLCYNKDVHESELEIAKLLVDASQGSLRSVDAEGDLPIHIAACSKPADFCKILIDADPESLEVTSQWGELPIHKACQGHFETLKYILELYPEMVRARESWEDGRFPIHFAANSFMNKNENTKIIQFLLNQDPAFAMAEDHFDNLPFHLACGDSDPNLNAIKLLFDSFPEALCLRQRNGLYILNEWQVNPLRTPNEQRKVVINFLEKQLAYAHIAYGWRQGEDGHVQDSNAIAMSDDKGWLPLHHAVHENASLGAIKLLVNGSRDAPELANGNEGAVQVAGRCGSFPLHIACEFSTADVVKFLVETYDGGLSQTDINRNYPLHRACLGGNCSVVSYLFERIEPRGALFISEPNKEEKLPLHLLIESDEVDRNSLAYQEALFLLIRAYPAALRNY